MEVQLSERAVRDLKKLGSAQTQIAKVLRALGEEPIPANIDIKLLQGREPWFRARAGSFRVIFRPLTSEDLAAMTSGSGRGFLVYRIVRRRDLVRVIARLYPYCWTGSSLSVVCRAIVSKSRSLCSTEAPWRMAGTAMRQSIWFRTVWPAARHVR